jgi:glutaredoxin 3
MLLIKKQFQGKLMLSAILYTKDHCQFCVKAKQLLKNKGIDYQEKIISAGLNESELLENQSYVTLEELKELAPNAKTVPQIWLLDGNKTTYIGGYTELAAFFKE